MEKPNYSFFQAYSCFSDFNTLIDRARFTHVTMQYSVCPSMNPFQRFPKYLAGLRPQTKQHQTFLNSKVLHSEFSVQLFVIFTFLSTKYFFRCPCCPTYSCRTAQLGSMLHSSWCRTGAATWSQLCSSVKWKKT